jgi:hypothetical protein
VPGPDFRIDEDHLVSAGLNTRKESQSRIDGRSASRDIALIDLLDRLVAGGVVLTGDITLAVADIDVVQVAVRALISSVSTLEGAGAPPVSTPEGAGAPP